MSYPLPPSSASSAATRRRDHDEVADRADAHRQRLAKTRRQAGRQRLHADAQRHRLHRGGLCRDAARRLWRAGELALQAGRDQLRAEGFRHVRADRACRHAASACARRSRRASPRSACRRRRKSLRTTRSIRDHLATPDFAIDFEFWLKQHPRYDGPAVPQPQNMIYTSGTTGHPKGVRRFAPTPEQTANGEAHARDDLRPQAGRPRVAARAALSFRAELVRPARRPSRRRAGADAALRPRGIPARHRDREDRHHLHGADHVHPADEAAGGNPPANTTCRRCATSSMPPRPVLPTSSAR